MPKKNSKLRLIVDLRRLNASSETLKFQCESIPTVCENKTSGSPTRDRRVTNRMGSSSRWQASSRLFARPSSATAVKLPRASSHPSRLKSFRARLKGQNRSSVIRQHCCCCLHQPSGWAQPKSRSPCLSSVGYRVRNGHRAHCEASGGKGKRTCRPTVSSIAPLRMAASSTPFRSLRSLPKSSSLHKHSSTVLQQPILRPGLQWRGCSRSVRLGKPQQFCKCPVSPYSQNSENCSRTAGRRQSNSAMVASTPWFLTLCTLSTCPPLRLPNRKHMFLQTSSTPKPLHDRAWKIYAWRICGRTK